MGEYQRGIMIFQVWTRLTTVLLATTIITTSCYAQNNDTFFRDGFWFKWDQSGRINDGGVLASQRKTEILEFHTPNLRGTPGTKVPFNFVISGKNLKEKPYLIIKGLPDNIKLNKGKKTDKVWSLTFENLANLHLIIPENFEKKFELELSLHFGKSIKPQTKKLTVDIKKEYNVTQFAIENIVGKPGEIIPVKLRIPNNITQENIQVIFRGLPENFSLSAGEKRATLWSVQIKELQDLKLITPKKYKGEFLLEVFFFKDKRSRPQRKLISVIIGKK